MGLRDRISWQHPFMEPVDWGIDSSPARFPGVSGDGFAPVESDDPGDMPVVLAASRQGYEPAPEAPMWTFLPAVWPASARAWILDTRIRHARISCDGKPAQVVPWCTADYFEVEADANELLVECGLPPRPAGRLWLLKSPPDQRSLHGTLELLVKSATGAGLDPMASLAFVEHVRLTLPELFRERQATGSAFLAVAVLTGRHGSGPGTPTRTPHRRETRGG